MDVRNLPAPVKRVVHLGTRSYGRLTAENRMLPSFLICGGQRCGTTSLYRALAAHPVVLKAVLHKGVHYFDTSYHRGLEWYRAHFPMLRSAEKIAERYGVPAQTFESSPYYMYHPQAAARIARDLPYAKLVVLVRDPVERAYSQHHHEVARAFESERDFGAALALEPARLHRQEERLATDPDFYSFAHQHHAYRARGEYARYLSVMAQHVGRERIHVVESERFFTDPGAVYDEVCTFLGLPADLERPPFERHNARPRESDMDPGLRRELRTYYQSHDEALGGWLGHTPIWRRG
ncbi:sulfotransferase domain-containing protein [Actinoplanes sp. GCM10030250]|uniref:sulfotransferase domain-containing protein n=1 Tax=Actinoplanes sp. GCM10030250 TaxID=3273376 RepID=UPI00361C10CC